MWRIIGKGIVADIVAATGEPLTREDVLDANDKLDAEEDAAEQHRQEQDALHPK